jgi:protein ImuB
VFEIESSLGLFGGWSPFEARLRSELGELGFRHRIVAAPNPAAARMLANAHDGLVVPDDQALRHHLGQLPVDRIGLEANVATALSRMGLRTLSQVQALPRHSLARRFEARCSSTWTPARFAALAAGVLSAAGPLRCAHRAQLRRAIPSGLLFRCAG